jgi:transcriptional regulator with XRE-family HTH domain
MSRNGEAAPSEYALAVAAEIRLQLESYGPPAMSGRNLAKLTGLSNNYVNMRLNGHAAFTLTDISAIAEALQLGIATLMSPGSLFSTAKVTPIRAMAPIELETIVRHAALHDEELDR